MRIGASENAGGILLAATTKHFLYSAFFDFVYFAKSATYLWESQIIEDSNINSISKLIRFFYHSLVIFIICDIPEFYKNGRHFCVF